MGRGLGQNHTVFRDVQRIRDVLTIAKKFIPDFQADVGDQRTLRLKHYFGDEIDIHHLHDAVFSGI
ncbi:hypothetical protein D3C72_2160980 [compost metagenome]